MSLIIARKDDDNISLEALRRAQALCNPEHRLDATLQVVHNSRPGGEPYLKALEELKPLVQGLSPTHPHYEAIRKLAVSWPFPRQ